MRELARWDSFYVIVGSAAGALIGLQFVVITLVGQRASRPAPDAGAAFATPTTVHFGAVLCLAALLRAPWDRLEIAATIWGVMGCIGFIYEIVTGWRMRRQTDYRPVFEDWLFHLILPLAAYGALAAAAFTARWRARETLFAVGAAALLLLFIGIHNAWDTAAWHVLGEGKGSGKDH